VRGEGEIVKVAVPSWRPDVEGKADLVEEVMRIHGVDNIARSRCRATGASTAEDPDHDADPHPPRQARARLARHDGSGHLVLHPGGTGPKLFGGGKPQLKLANPIAADMSDMRPSLLPGLISAAAQRNADRGYGDVALFEVSGTYEGDTPEGQRRVAGGIRRGTAGLTGGGRHWDGAATPSACSTPRPMRSPCWKPAARRSPISDRAGRARLVSSRAAPA
jgi:phenylalanyl-tRNA synthetase beta chain